uniref:Uncharacterized protein n=1 Tax=Rhizophora mucronata TaxID=61149 RepID=A0A2P2KEY7_RHIMU
MLPQKLQNQFLKKPFQAINDIPYHIHSSKPQSKHTKKQRKIPLITRKSSFSLKSAQSKEDKKIL